MKTLKILVVATRILAMFYIIAGLLSHLALTNIALFDVDSPRAINEW